LEGGTWRRTTGCGDVRKSWHLLAKSAREQQRATFPSAYASTTKGRPVALAIGIRIFKLLVCQPHTLSIPPTLTNSLLENPIPNISTTNSIPDHRTRLLETPLDSLNAPFPTYPEPVVSFRYSIRQEWWPHNDKIPHVRSPVPESQLFHTLLVCQRAAD